MKTQTTEQNAQHTPGPWKIMADPQHAGKHPCHDNRWIVSGDAEIEFGNDPRDWDLSRGTLICQMRDHVGAPEANARLIAAAPEVLAMLQTLADHCDGLAIDLGHVDPAELKPGTVKALDATIDAARAAIAKATGNA